MNTLQTLLPEHRAAWELLPWLVNGTLDDDEAAAVERHLEACDTCRAEIAAQRDLARALRQADELAFTPERGLERLERRLDAEAGEEGEAATALGARHLLASTPRPVRLALLAQAAAIVVLLTTFVFVSTRPASFRVLSTPTSSQPQEATLRVVFAEGVREVELRELLASLDARIVDGPTAFGVYTVAADNRGAALASLRRSELVAFAEPASQP